MKNSEQLTETKELTSAEMLKDKASDRVKEDIAYAETQLGENDLSDDFVLMAKLSGPAWEREQARIASYSQELKEIEAGSINPEYVLYAHADTEGKMQATLEKTDPSSELGKVLGSKTAVNQLTENQKEYVKEYAEGLLVLRAIADQLSLRQGSEETNRLEQNSAALSRELRQKKARMLDSLGDQKKADTLQEMCRTYEKNLKLREFLEVEKAFSEKDHKLQVENVETKKVVPTWHGQMNGLYAEFKASEQRNFPRAPDDKAEKVEERIEQKPESPVEIEKKEVSRSKEQDVEILKRVRESLGIAEETEESPQESPKKGKEFFSPESIYAFNNGIEQLSTHFGALDRILRNRADDRLTDLIDDNSRAGLSGAMRRLQGVDISKPEDFENISELLKQLHDGIESIGTVRSRNFRDSADSLRSISGALTMIAEGSGDLSRQLKSMGTPDALDTAKRVDRLADIAADRRMAMLRRRDQVSEYLR